MSTVLRRQAMSGRTTRSLLNHSSLYTYRNARITPSCTSPFAHRIRTFASKPPAEFKNEKIPETKNDKTPGKPASGFEGMYNNNSPLSPPPNNSKDPQGSKTSDGKTQFSKLSKEEEAQLNRLLETAKTGLPTSLVKDVETAFDHIKKQGIPKELRELMDDVSKSKKSGITLSQAAKVIRIVSRTSRQAAEEAVKTEKEQGEKTSEDGSKSKSEGKKEQKGNPEFKLNEIKIDTSTFLTAAFTAYLLYRMVAPAENTKEITWQDFKTSFLDKGLVEKLVVTNKSQVKVHLHRDAVAQQHPESPAVHGHFHYVFSIGSVEAFERKMDEAQDNLGIPSSERIPVSYNDEVPWTNTLITIGYLFLPLLFFAWVQRRMNGAGGTGGQSGIFGMGRSRAKKFNHETDIKIRFKDVAGMDEAKTEIMEFVAFLKEPEQFQRLGAKIPRGAILSGPPGTGKTLLAKATAGESQVPFFSVSGSEFVEMFVGVGASRVRDLFANARKSTPCIIFIDEIDAIGKSRSKQQFGGGNDEREATLNQILTEMDGFNTSEQVVVLAGTNRPDVLDSALMRPGRFDRHIAIDRPTMDGRKQIFGVHLQKIITNENMEHLKGRLAALTPGFSGADIANACNEAALIAARAKADKVEMTHFEQAIERTVGGLEKKSLVLSPEEKKVVAYHEAGHAICGWYFKWADPLLKVSIIPRGQGALGYAQYLPDGDSYLMNVNQLMDRMAMTLGGRVSEELHFETVTSGASDDFKKVTRMATAMVSKFGMSKKIGYLFFEEDQNQLHKPFSEETARNIDAEVRRIVDEAYTQCKDLLTEKKKEVGLVAEELLKNEVLSRDDMIRLLGKRPFESKGEFEKYFNGPGGKSAPPPPPTEGSIGNEVPAPTAPAFKQIE